MAISPILFNGSVSRMQDVSSVKHNEDVKGMVDQNNFQNTFHKQIDSKLNQVHQSDTADNHQKKFDAKEKGSNAYDSDGGKRRKKENEAHDGKVIVKSTSGFDMKV